MPIHRRYRILALAVASLLVFGLSAVPPVAIVRAAVIGLTINDVSQGEGNAGTTTFTFTVSLSSPADPGGVTFDIATADGSAEDDNPGTEDEDYVAQSLTGQTIAAGSSTYQFNVTVNGDLDIETDESFAVNVSNVTGAGVVDGQGQGTIVNDDAPSADLSVTKTDSPDPVAAGDNLTYTITATNGGPDEAASVQVTDTLPTGTTFVSVISPAGWSCTTPAVGATGTLTCSNQTFGVTSAVFTLTVNVGGSVAGGTVLTNTASVSSATADPDGTENSDTETTTVTAPSADVSITKTESPDPVTAGNNLTYTITATNSGPDAAASAQVSDTLPTGTTFVSLTAPAGWNCTTPAVGATGTVTCSNPTFAITSAVFTLVVAVDSGVAGATVLTNTASVSSDTADPDGTDDSDTEQTTVNAASADLGVTKTDSPDPVTAGNNITYTITATNAGPNPAASAQMSDVIPTGTTFVSLTAPGGWTCTTPAVGGTGTVTCGNPTFAVTSAQFTLVVAVDPGLAAGTLVTNTASISSDTADPDATDDADTEQTTVTAPTVIVSAPQIAKAFSPTTVGLGGTTYLTFTITNPNSTTALTGVAVSDALPVGLVVSNPNGLTGSCGGGTITASPGSSTVSLTGATIAGAGSCTFGVNVTARTIGTKENVSGRVTSTNGGSGNRARATLHVREPDLTITKRHVGQFTRGGNGTYVITVRNVGAGPTSGRVTVVDLLPLGLSAPRVTASGWTCLTLGLKVTCATQASLPAGSSYPPITISVRVGVATLRVVNKALVSGGGDVTILNNVGIDMLGTIR